MRDLPLIGSMHEVDGPEIQVFGKRDFIHHPWQVGRFHVAIDHWAGDVEGGVLDGGFHLSEKLQHLACGLGKSALWNCASASGACGPDSIE
jgi:hypothetical protein